MARGYSSSILVLLATATAMTVTVAQSASSNRVQFLVGCELQKDGTSKLADVRVAGPGSGRARGAASPGDSVAAASRPGVSEDRPVYYKDKAKGLPPTLKGLPPNVPLPGIPLPAVPAVPLPALPLAGDGFFLPRGLALDGAAPAARTPKGVALPRLGKIGGGRPATLATKPRFGAPAPAPAVRPGVPLKSSRAMDLVRPKLGAFGNKQIGRPSDLLRAGSKRSDFVPDSDFAATASDKIKTLLSPPLGAAGEAPSPRSLFDKTAATMSRNADVLSENLSNAFDGALATIKNATSNLRRATGRAAGGPPRADDVGAAAPRAAGGCDVCECLMKRLPRSFRDGRFVADDAEAQASEVSETRVRAPSSFGTAREDDDSERTTPPGAEGDPADAPLRPAATSAERAETFENGIRKMIEFVDIVDQLDQYISDKTKMIITSLSKMYEGDFKAQIL